MALTNYLACAKGYYLNWTYSIFQTCVGTSCIPVEVRKIKIYKHDFYSYFSGISLTRTFKIPTFLFEIKRVREREGLKMLGLRVEYCNCKSLGHKILQKQTYTQFLLPERNWKCNDTSGNRTPNPLIRTLVPYRIGHSTCCVRSKRIIRWVTGDTKG